MALTFPTFKELVFSKKGPLVELFEMVKTQLNAIDARINVLDGAGEIELTQLEHSTEGKTIVYNASGVAEDVAISGDATLAANGELTIGEDKIDSTKIPLFVSTEQTGTGDAQSIAHGLGVEPATVMVLLSSVGVDGATYTFTKGSANVNVTATSGAKYFVVAIT